MQRELPLCGRDVELAAVSTWLTDRDGPRTLLVVGDAGVGKSRLVAEASRVAGRRGMGTLWVAANESTRSVALGALAPFLQGPFRSSVLALAGLAERMLPSESAESSVVVVDDAHLLDDASAAVVRQLLARPTVFLLLSVRSGSRPPDAIDGLWRDVDVPTLELPPLSERGSALLMAEVLGGPVRPGAQVRLWSWSRGNPLFLRHLIASGLRTGHLQLVADQWDWVGAAAISSGLVESVESMMGDLDAPLSELLDLLSLCEPLSLRVLDELCQRSTVETAEDQGLVRVSRDADTQVHLAHPLYGEVRRHGMGTLRGRRLRGRLVEVLARDPGAQTDGEILRRALLSLDSDVAPDPGLLTSAAQQASKLVDLDAAQRLARAAIAAGAGAEARLVLAHILGLYSEVDAAEELLAEIVDAGAGQSELERVYVTRAAIAIWPARDPDRLDTLIAEATATLTGAGAGPTLAALDSLRHAVRGRWRACASAGEQALASAGLDPLGGVAVAFGLLIAYACLGEVENIDSAAEWGYAKAMTEPDAALVSFGLCHLHITALQRVGELDAVDTLARSRYDELSLLPGRTTVFGLGLIGHADLAHGRVQEARAALMSALEKLPATESSGFRYLCRLHLAMAHALAGQVAASVAILSDLEADAHPAFTFLEPEVHLARAWQAASLGATSEAVRNCHDAARAAVELDGPAAEVLAWHTAVGFGDPSAQEPLTRLARRVGGRRARVALRQSRALAVKDGASLLAVADELEAAGDLLAAANAAGQSATVFRGEGRSGSAATATARALGLRERCQGARTPALLEVATPLPLTERQREVASLAALGLSNQEVAARLCVSVRTVEGHLYRACAALGVHTRADLSLVLGLADPGAAG